mmetsp:Transcript_44502/g.93362  ORF Transcript_44502/g.93362 Transcript_44502/m.93362 type:complete len:107 (+) Transcript_44502:405-725(+)
MIQSTVFPCRHQLIKLIHRQPQCSPPSQTNLPPTKTKKKGKDQGSAIIGLVPKTTFLQWLRNPYTSKGKYLTTTRLDFQSRKRYRRRKCTLGLGSIYGRNAERSLV